MLMEVAFSIQWMWDRRVAESKAELQEGFLVTVKRLPSPHLEWHLYFKSPSFIKMQLLIIVKFALWLWTFLKISSDIKTLETLLDGLDLFIAWTLPKPPWVLTFCIFRPFTLLLAHLQLSCLSVAVCANCVVMLLTDPWIHFPQPCMWEQSLIFVLFSWILHQGNTCQVVFQQQLDEEVFVPPLLLIPPSLWSQRCILGLPDRKDQVAHEYTEYKNSSGRNANRHVICMGSKQPLPPMVLFEGQT